MKPIFRFVRPLFGGFLLLVFLVPLSGMNPLLAQWVQTNGPGSGYVTSFATSETNLFAGTFVR